MNVIADVLDLKGKHRKTWRNRPQFFWLLGLLEEVWELILALLGLHKDAPDWELKQISAIAMNWLELRAGEDAVDPAAELARIKECIRDYWKIDAYPSYQFVVDALGEAEAAKLGIRFDGDTSEYR